MPTHHYLQMIPNTHCKNTLKTSFAQIRLDISWWWTSWTEQTRWGSKTCSLHATIWFRKATSLSKSMISNSFSGWTRPKETLRKMSTGILTSLTMTTWLRKSNRVWITQRWPRSPGPITPTRINLATNLLIYLFTRSRTSWKATRASINFKNLLIGFHRWVQLTKRLKKISQVTISATMEVSWHQLMNKWLITLIEVVKRTVSNKIKLTVRDWQRAKLQFKLILMSTKHC